MYIRNMSLPHHHMKATAHSEAQPWRQIKEANPFCVEPMIFTNIIYSLGAPVFNHDHSCHDDIICLTGGRCCRLMVVVITCTRNDLHVTYSNRVAKIEYKNSFIET